MWCSVGLLFIIVPEKPKSVPVIYNQSMPIAIRPACTSDYALFCQLYNQVNDLHVDAHPEMFQRLVAEVVEENVYQQMLDEVESAIFIAEVDGTPAGMAEVSLHDTPPYPVIRPRCFALVESIVVLSEFQRAGTGAALMEKVEDWARQNGAETCELNVYAFNSGALAFYRQLGYGEVSQRMRKKLIDR